MNLRIYGAARWKFATAAWSWVALTVNARLYGPSYVANLETDQKLPSDWIADLQLVNKTVNQQGYARCDPIEFLGVVNSVSITQMVLVATNTGIPMFNLPIAEIKPSTEPRPIKILFGGDKWLFRL